MKERLAIVVLMLSLALLAAAQAPSGSQSATAPNAQTPPGTSGDASVNPPGSSNQNDSMLQSQIESAIRNEPALSSGHIVVKVSEESIDLSGTVGSSKDKLTAERIAQSFDGNRKMNDSLMITRQKLANGQTSSGANNPPKPPPR